ncbi:50S ribosomal protein L21 [candidate division WWE3 bacterium RIFCSPHIGHO2_12_FULL_38_15]|uniref:Large ribosomal subunit protein bL21 n=1 Tax=candidate division WWE3 bacterium RIFCSPHIGHO2_02_FULL_38_14 TaxID=1802620 RepID=A0A1F4VAV1_UNCKA|nr:MAG: 50S ribosomal protein L21 [candidate division WWE3 bacterium RIFCSPHIGHO2_01_FULL_38_45]OGC49351.1 MAG: 50S ribosomal protein L21 [candidate division WWE3 bacterium RIFCSPHIGHO2_12_FULL_38_15]OGC53954.1 MAG: 50S ribosomal protein L21 [candidate division WWE3 bacterium RIFCSPLOWO2_01_FULL_37_24]OGC54030.1 MAG: 50S ribosomal protein L21 [candidate division WWE3 bacterium RIFCSPHIGHO2_02_FULL_38_14]HLB51457.1 50S ribosomal protein L21 [Patescibacteria group bacterium]
MKYAVIKLDGKQLKVLEGQKLKVNRQPKIEVEVLAYSNGTDLYVGDPYLTDVKVKTSVLGEETGKKVTIQRFKSKSRYRVKKGHKQPLTAIRIDEINKTGEDRTIQETKPVKIETRKKIKSDEVTAKKTSKVQEEIKTKTSKVTDQEKNTNKSKISVKKNNKL